MDIQDYGQKILEARLKIVERELGLPDYAGIKNIVSSKDFMEGNLSSDTTRMITGFIGDEFDGPLCLEANRETYEDCLRDSPEFGYPDEPLLPILHPFTCYCNYVSGRRGHLATSSFHQEFAVRKRAV